jgi:hypothetical protein
MKKTPLYLLLFCLVLLATGCPNEPSRNLSKENKNAIANRINTYLAEAQDAFNVPNTDPAARKRIRNDAIEEMLALIDSNYHDYITRLANHRATTDFLADVIELGTGAATGIAKGERPNQILGIALTAFRGGRRSAELNFYREQTTPILIAKMDDNRSRIYAGILQKKARTADDYSFKEAIRDMVAYFNAGTLIRAFTELAKDTSTSAAASEEAVRVLRGEVKLTDIPTLEVANLTDAVFAQRRSLAQQVRDLRTKGTAAGEEAARAIPLPTPADAANVTAAEQTAIAEAEARREAARKEKLAETLKPAREKLEMIWNEVEAADAFKPSVEKLKTDDRAGAILKKTAENRTEAEYLTLLDRLAALIQDDAALSGQFLAILKRGNS